MQALCLRVCAGCSILALAVLSWLPAADLMRTGIITGSQEHFLAYAISGMLVAAAMPRFRFVHVAIFYVLLATILELGQNFAPGRDAETFTAFVSMSVRASVMLERSGVSQAMTPLHQLWSRPYRQP